MCQVVDLLYFESGLSTRWIDEKQNDSDSMEIFKIPGKQNNFYSISNQVDRILNENSSELNFLKLDLNVKN